ncbi:MAG: hypothetical protein ACI88G_002165 [Woeseiaceae bacterium]|jgi:hypothetical protein
MGGAQGIPWPRLLAESIAIVGSILLAFAIDAWWEQRSENEQAQILLSSLYSDFRASSEELEIQLARNKTIQESSAEFLREIRESELGAEISIPMRVLIATMGSPTFGPTASSVDLAFSSGRIELIEDAALRAALAAWRQQIEDTAEEEIRVQDIVTHRLIPELSTQVRLGAFEVDAVLSISADQNPGGEYDEEALLRVSSELEGIMSQRVFLGTIVVANLTTTGKLQEQVLQMLDDYVNN